MEKIARAFRRQGIRGEVVFVNDGSTDRTQKALEEACARHDFMRAVRHLKSRGLSEVINTGLKHLHGDIVILLPADLESDPEEDIPKLLQEMDKGYDAVAGWRQGRKDGKVIASNIYNYVSRKLFGLQVHDMNWIKAVRREILVETQLRSDWYRFLLPVLAEQGYKIGEVRTNWYPRKAGRSKFGVSRFLVSFFDVLAVKFLLTFTRKPMFFFGVAGGIFMLAGAGLALGLAYLFFVHAMQVRPLLLFAFVCFLAGLILLMMGFLAELIVDGHQRIERIEEQIGKAPSRKRPGE